MSNESDINSMESLIHNAWKIAEDKGFHKDKENQHPLIKLALVMSEVGEAVEAYRTGNHQIGKPVEFIKDSMEDEIADIIIRLFDMWILIGHKPEELVQCINDKLGYNSTREYMHGKNC